MGVLKLNDKGSAVKALQKILGIKETGIFDKTTEIAVKEFQKRNNILADGIVGPKTSQLLNFNVEIFLSTDLQNVTTAHDYIITLEGLKYKRYYLDPEQYIKKDTSKKYLILHHTVGSHNPYNTIRDWNNDTRGRIATQFVIGGISLNGNDEYDGLVLETFPDYNWAYHIGDNGNSELHPCSVGIEICNYGPLIRKKDGKYYNYVNNIVPENQVCDLGFDFKGYRYYHKYSDKQIESLKLLLKEIIRRNPNINYNEGLKKWLKTEEPAKAFDYKEEAYKGLSKGILSHSNIRKDKFDIVPQPKIVELIKSL